MNKLFIRSFSFYIGLFMCSRVSAQLNITGPTCVLPGVVYSYQVHGAWTAKSTMQVCVAGGVMAGKDTTLGNCTPAAGAPLGSVLVKWSTKGSASLKVTSGTGSSTLNVSVTGPLVCGKISDSSKTQIIGIDSLPAPITCSADVDGNCSPAYVNQWQQSLDNVSWKDIPGAISQNLSFNNPLTQTFFYRRKTIERGSSAVGYSDVAVVFTIPAAQQLADGMQGGKSQ
jgi:hypothetical protein